MQCTLCIPVAFIQDSFLFGEIHPQKKKKNIYIYIYIYLGM